METNIRKRKGKIIFTRKYLREQASESELEALFSVFFPMAIVDRHEYSLYDFVTYVGYSRMFDIKEEGELAPEYIPQLINNNGKVFVTKMERK